MRANSSPMSVADYCTDYNAGKIKVNSEYQRNVGLWTSQARAYFVESILLQFPIPKIYLHAKLDLKSRQTVKEVVDGQQRTQALTMFFNNKQRLTNNIDTEELRGLNYKQLDESWQERFLTYSLPIDQFSGAQDADIREAFRRMNANNVPLNDEEQRNAKFQGPFKWFLVGFAEKFEAASSALGVFTRRDLIRMADLKVYAEVLHTVDDGFHTIKGRQIDDLYRKYNGEFPQEVLYKRLLGEGVSAFFEREYLHRRQFLKPHIFQSIVLALIFADRNPSLGAIEIEESEQVVGEAKKIAPSLEMLGDALSEPDLFPKLSKFVDACSKKTNVALSRFVRYAYFKEAIARA